MLGRELGGTIATAETCDAWHRRSHDWSACRENIVRTRNCCAAVWGDPATSVSHRVCVCVCVCVCWRAPKPSAPTIGDVLHAMREIEGGRGAASRESREAESVRARGGLPLSPPCERAAAWAAGRRLCEPVCDEDVDGESRRHRLRAEAASRGGTSRVRVCSCLRVTCACG